MTLEKINKDAQRGAILAAMLSIMGCVHRPSTEDVNNVNTVSLYELAVDEGRWDGQIISIQGFFIESAGINLLVPDEEYYLTRALHARGSGYVIWIGTKKKGFVFPRLNTYVQLTGRFSAEDVGIFVPYSGSLDEISGFKYLHASDIKK